MTRIGGPYMFEYQAPDPAYSGVSGLVVIAESHIAIHTFPELDYFTMDIFSCKNFDHEVAIAYIREALGVREMDRMLVQRGLSFRGPHHGPLGATDELISAAESRNNGLGVTIGSIPTDDPLYPRMADVGAMLWPSYGAVPDVGSCGTVTGGARDGAVVTAANAAAAGDVGRPGLLPIQPLQLNPTASTSGIMDRMLALGGQGRQLGKALQLWEATVRAGNAPVVLAIGADVVAQGLRDVVADLIQRGHIQGIILEDSAAFADAFESLGYRHYLREDDELAPAIRPEDESQAARTKITAMLGHHHNATIQQLADALAHNAPRPGILTAAIAAGIPIGLAGSPALKALGVTLSDNADILDLVAQPETLLIACGTRVAINAGQAQTIAIAAPTQSSVAVALTLDAPIALTLLATGLVQRVPQRHVSRSNARQLLSVG